MKLKIVGWIGLSAITLGIGCVPLEDFGRQAPALKTFEASVNYWRRDGKPSFESPHEPGSYESELVDRIQSNWAHSVRPRAAIQDPLTYKEAHKIVTEFRLEEDGRIGGFAVIECDLPNEIVRTCEAAIDRSRSLTLLAAPNMPHPHAACNIRLTFNFNVDDWKAEMEEYSRERDAKLANLLTRPGMTPEISAALKRRELAIGMNADDVIYLYGNPEGFNRTTTANGVHDQWVYRTLGRYVYLENGQVQSWQESR